MDTALTNPGVVTREHASAPALPGLVVAMAVGATSVIVGVIWDISWHSTIGRDTFWTPAHVAIYLGGLIGGLGGGWQALRLTFAGSARQKATTVRFWGFHAPLGAWMAIWGAIAMLTSAPFDDWWHSAYGLDVEILSPPHTLLALGIGAIIVGALLLALAAQNRSPDGARSAAGVTFLYVAGLLVSMFTIMGTDFRWTNNQHAGTFYLVFCTLLPMLLVGTSRASGHRWAATWIATAYMAVNAAMIWILPLFAAQPLLAPIHRPVDRMVTDVFPLLLIVPALALDLVRRRLGGRDHFGALVLGALFFGTFLVTQWLFSSFLLSSAADNAFFGSNHWSYNARPGDWETTFWGLTRDPFTWRTVMLALAASVVSTRLGLWWGGWMQRVQR